MTGAAEGRPGRNRVVAVWLFGALTVGSAGGAAADGLRRLDAAWLVPSRLASTVVGVGPPEVAAGVWVRAGQARLYGLPELPVRRLAAGLAGSGGRWAVEGGWETTGSRLLRDDRLDGRLGWGRRLRWGLRTRWRRLRPGPGSPLTDRSWDLEVGLSTTAGALGGVEAGLQWPLWRTAEAHRPAEPVTLLRLAVAGRGRAVALALDVGADGRPTAGWEVLCALGRGAGLAWRVDQASGAMGTGLTWRRGRLRVRTSHLTHPELGLTHRFELTLGAVEASPW